MKINKYIRKYPLFLVYKQKEIFLQKTEFIGLFTPALKSPIPLLKKWQIRFFQ